MSKMKKKSKFLVKKIRGSTALPIQMVTVVPSTRGSTKIKDATHRRRTNEVREYVAKKFGGYTSSKAKGGYIMRNGKLVKEQVQMVTTFASRDKYKKNKSAWLKYVKKKGKQWGQESMGVIVENDMYYLKTKR